MNFEYVPVKERRLVRNELFEIIHKLQYEIGDKFTFQYHFMGSRRRNMTTRDLNVNIGFDFDVNLLINDPDEKYSPKETEPHTTKHRFRCFVFFFDFFALRY